LVTGWFWSLLMLLPVIGLVQVGAQPHADGYTYLPQIGLYILLAWAVTDALASRFQRRILGVTACVAVIVLAWCAHIQASYWRDGESLWSHAISATSRNFEAHGGLGQFLLDHGRVDEAIDQFQIALSIDPGYPEARTNLAIALTKKGRIDEAITHLQTVLNGYPNDAKAAYERALQSRPVYPEVENNIGLALLKEGRPSEAIAHWENALANESDFVAALNNLAWVLASFPEASIRNGNKALRLAERANQLSGGKDPAVLRTL